MAPAARLEVVMERVGAATVRARLTDLAWAGLPASVTLAVKAKLPEAVGVPDRAPEDDSVMPAGRAPAVIDHM